MANMFRLMALFAVDSILGCSINICMTWEYSNQDLVLKCKVNKLYLEVDFIDPNKNSKGHCLVPFPFSDCISKDDRIQISQNTSTNETVMKFQNVGKQGNGIWTCRHGSQKNEATIEVTISPPEVKCWELLFCVLSGFIAPIVVLGIGIVITRVCYRKKGSDFLERKLSSYLGIIIKCCHFDNCITKTSTHSACNCKNSVCFVITLVVVVVTLILGMEVEHFCKDPYPFIAMGALPGVIVVFVRLLNVEGESNNQHPEREERVTGESNNQHPESEKGVTGESNSQHSESGEAELLISGESNNQHPESEKGVTDRLNAPAETGIADSDV